MRAVTRRVYDTGARILDWVLVHPAEEVGFTVLVTQLRAIITRMAQLIGDQRSGTIDSRAASDRKQELRRTILSGPIAHLAQIGTLAAVENHELAKTFRFKPTADTYLAFQSAAWDMYKEAQLQKEVLVKHGLSEAVLAEFGSLMNEWDAAVRLGSVGRMIHTAATRELDTLTMDAGRIIRAMDTRNRRRFQSDPQALELWTSARTVLGGRAGAQGRRGAEAPDDSAPQTGNPEGSPPGGGVRPAA